MSFALPWPVLCCELSLVRHLSHVAETLTQPSACGRCQIIRGGMEQYLTPMGPTKLHVNPIFEIGPIEPRFSEWLVFEVHLHRSQRLFSRGST